MDRTKDSGSFDASSILAGTTKIPSVTELVEVHIHFLIYFTISPIRSGISIVYNRHVNIFIDFIVYNR